MKWYAIHTQSGYENKLKEAIETLVASKGMESCFGEIIIPEVEIEEIKDGKKKMVRRNVYPGYIFIQMEYTEESWFLIKNVAFMRKPAFVGERKRFSSKKAQEVEPTPVTLSEIMRVKKMMEDGEVKSSSDVIFEKGEMVLIKDGAFAGFKAVVDEVKDGKDKLEVLVNIFGRSTPVELSFSQVEKVEE